jgi:hypothetical protein
VIDITHLGEHRAAGPRWKFVTGREDDRRVGRLDMAENRETKRGYGRNWKRLVAIYLAVGAVVYLLVFLALRASDGSGGLY